MDYLHDPLLHAGFFARVEVSRPVCFVQGQFRAGLRQLVLVAVNLDWFTQIKTGFGDGVRIVEAQG
jgi:hypothetical protein